MAAIITDNMVDIGPNDGGRGGGNLKPPPITIPQLEGWMDILIKQKPEVLDWPLTKLCLPGTHDSATYGPGALPTNVARFNWQCQDLNMYEQARLGVRYFDLRLEQENDSWNSPFYPYHGGAKHTGDRFSKTINEAGGVETIAGQLRRFIEQHPTELLILNISLKGTKPNTTTPGGTICNALMDKALHSADSPRAPNNGAIPTVRQMRDSRKNILLLAGAMPREDVWGPNRQRVEDYIWKAPGRAIIDGPYNESDWKSNDPKRVQAAIESWMNDHSHMVGQRSHFWNAQCQLTPKVNNVGEIISSLWDDSMTTSPRKLSEVMNPYVRDVLMTNPKWKQNVSIVSTDFPDQALILSIVKLNF